MSAGAGSNPVAERRTHQDQLTHHNRSAPPVREHRRGQESQNRQTQSIGLTLSNGSTLFSTIGAVGQLGCHRNCPTDCELASNGKPDDVHDGRGCFCKCTSEQAGSEQSRSPSSRWTPVVFRHNRLLSLSARPCACSRSSLTIETDATRWRGTIGSGRMIMNVDRAVERAGAGDHRVRRCGHDRSTRPSDVVGNSGLTCRSPRKAVRRPPEPYRPTPTPEASSDL